MGRARFGDRGMLELVREPLHGGGVAVDENVFGGVGFFDELEDVIPRGVAAEVKDLHVAVEFHGGKLGVEVDHVASLGGSDSESGGGGVGVADEEEGIARVVDEAPGEIVGDRFLGHHAAGKGVDGPWIVADGLSFAAVAGFDVHVAQDLEAGVDAPRGVGELVVDDGHLRAETTDDDGGVGEISGVLVLVKHGEDLLGFSHREDGNENGAASLKGVVDGRDEACFLGLPFVVRITLAVSAGGFDDESVDVLEVRKGGAFAEGMVFEVDVAGVEDPFAVAFEKDAGGAEDVAGIVEGGADVSIDIDVEGFLVVAALEAAFAVVEVFVAVEGVFLDAQLGLLRCHHIDRIVKEGVGEGGCGVAHVDPGAGLVLHEDGEGADVVKMGMADEDGIDAVEGQILVAGEGRGAPFLGVHSGIEDDAEAAEFEEIAICSDFVGAGEECEGWVRHDEGESGGAEVACQSFTE